MAATLDGIATLASDTGFQTRVKASLVWCAAQIIQETQELVSPAPLDKYRRALALHVVEDLDVYVPRFAWLVAQIPAAELDINDANLVAAVRAVWNHLARPPM